MKFNCAEVDGFSRPKSGFYNEKDYPLDIIVSTFWSKFPGLKGATVRNLNGRGMRGILMDEYTVVRTATGLECVQKKIAHLKGKPYVDGVTSIKKAASPGHSKEKPEGKRQKGAKPNLDSIEGLQAEIARLQAQLEM